MKHPRKSVQIAAVGILLSVALVAGVTHIRNLQPFRDTSGYVATYNVAGDFDQTNAFFQSLGTNGRTCATCHQVEQSMGLEVKHVRKLFTATKGKHPLFAPVDGANCPDIADNSDPASHSALLNNGLIRVGINLPQNAEFNLTVVRDPYDCAITTDTKTGMPVVSVYRRPLPAASLRFLSTVMWDGRETIAPLNNEATFRQNLVSDLKHQAFDAVMGHAQADTPPNDEQLTEIVKFEMGLFTAQVSDNRAGPLYAARAKGGPLQLEAQSYYPGANDSLGSDPHGKVFNPKVFDLYANWLPGGPGGFTQEADASVRAARAEIAAGEQLFNTAPLKITGVRGLNDSDELGYPKEITGTCTTCHDSPNVGNHSLPLPLDIGTSRSAEHDRDANIAAGLAELSQPDVPLYLITNCSDPQDPTRRVAFYTSDPGKGLLTGKCSDVNRIKGPVLRGLAARAPYFHNGSAVNLNELVKFYNKRFQMNLTETHRRELVAFLNTL